MLNILTWDLVCRPFEFVSIGFSPAELLQEGYWNTASSMAHSSHDALLDRILDVAVSAAKEAGGLMRSRLGRTPVGKTKFTTKDLVTEVDIKCQAAIQAHITASFPEHSMLGEESVPPGSAASASALAEFAAKEWLWIVDPLDGTTMFAHGIPSSVVSIGVAHKGTVVVSCIYNPYLEELFTAIKGRGAFCSGERIHVANDTTEMAGALWATGFHHTEHIGGLMVKALATLLRASRGVRCLGSAAMHLAYVAAGRFTGACNRWHLLAFKAVQRNLHLGHWSGVPIASSILHQVAVTHSSPFQCIAISLRLQASRNWT
jgi:myo-inositol-1(or 4)-monophosphatase